MSGREERTEQPTPRRRREARRKGQLARSPDLVLWVQLLAASFVLRLSSGLAAGALSRLLPELETAITHPETDTALRLFSMGLQGGALALVPLLGATVVIGLAGNLAQTGLAATPAALRPKWERLSPAKGLRRLLSPASGWEAAKTLLKLGVLAAVAWPAVSRIGASMAGGARPPAGELLGVVGGAALDLMRNTALAGLALAAVDYGLQRRRVRRATMMTRQEVKEEHRQSEGDPFMRSRIRQRQVEMSRNRMMAEVGRATMVVVNPTHIAVALRYVPQAGAPRVVAKGQGAVAARIREEAERHGVPVVRDVPLARTLHVACRLGQEIPADLYEAVARLLAFVFSLARRPAQLLP